MARKSTDKKEIILGIILLLGGVALTALSFCIYYLVKPQNTAVLIALCAVDFLYNLFTTCLACKICDADKWLLKGLLLSVIYTVAFIAVGVLFAVVNVEIEWLKNNILGIVFYAFFTGPCIFIVMAIFFLGLAYA